MKISYHGAWFTTEQAKKIFDSAVSNFRSCTEKLVDTDIEVVLWTNIDKLSPESVTDLKQKGITYKNYSELSSSRFYTFFLRMLFIGEGGDKAALALASDIFRMCILELSDDDECVIYTDPNDVFPYHIKEDLLALPNKIAGSQNSLGLWFFVAPLSFGQDRATAKTWAIRNDILIALKSINPGFFEKWFEAYRLHLEDTIQSYSRPSTATEACALAQRISATPCGYSMNCNPTITLDIEGARDGGVQWPSSITDVVLPSSVVDCKSIFNTVPHCLEISQFSCTWHPGKDNQSQEEKTCDPDVPMTNNVTSDEPAKPIDEHQPTNLAGISKKMINFTPPCSSQQRSTTTTVTLSSLFTAAAGAPDGDPGGSSTMTCFEDDPENKPQKKIVRQGNMSLFKDNREGRHLVLKLRPDTNGQTTEPTHLVMRLLP